MMTCAGAASSTARSLPLAPPHVARQALVVPALFPVARLLPQRRSDELQTQLDDAKANAKSKLDVKLIQRPQRWH
jgi:hypothetical protein